MKIRNGYVSNSSSSSFCIIGKEITEEEYDMIIDGYAEHIKKTIEVEPAYDNHEIVGMYGVHDLHMIICSLHDVTIRSTGKHIEYLTFLGIDTFSENCRYAIVESLYNISIPDSVRIINNTLKTIGVDINIKEEEIRIFTGNSMDG